MRIIAKELNSSTERQEDGKRIKNRNPAMIYLQEEYLKIK